MIEQRVGAAERLLVIIRIRLARLVAAAAVRISQVLPLGIDEVVFMLLLRLETSARANELCDL